MLTNIRRWLAAPVFEGEEEKSRTASLLNLILWTFILASLAYGVFAPIEPEVRLRRAAIIVTFVLVMVISKLMINWGYVRSIGVLIVLCLWLMITVAMFFGADYNNPAFMGYVVVVVCAGLVLNWRAATAWGLLSIFTSAVFLVLGENGVLPHSAPVHPFAFWVAQTAYIFVSMLLISQSLRKIDEAFARAGRELNERKRVEAEREKIINELEAKNTELERFTYTVSHDLKSPLITISGFIGLLETDVQSGNAEKFNEDLFRINEAAAKMKRLLDELLELSRIGRIVNPPSDTPFATIVTEALSLVDGRIRAGKIKTIVHDNLPIVHGDRPRLVEVLQNLIDNAAKFMGDQTEPVIEIGVRNQKQGPVFFVRDNGIGIETAHREKIFGLFDKLNPHSEGTGVGLALARRIVEVHGGSLWVESAGAGTGSMFCFTLPIKKDMI